MGEPFDVLVRLYSQALKQPISHAEITELTGNNLSATDIRASKAAWLLMKIEDLKILGVHSRLWHRKGEKFSVPLLDQLSISLNIDCPVNNEKLQKMGYTYSHTGNNQSMIDVVGVKNSEIYVVHTVHNKNICGASVTGAFNSQSMFRDIVFDNIILNEDILSTLHNTQDVFKVSFHRPINTMVLVMHPTLPDFELYKIDLMKHRNSHFKLNAGDIVRNSWDYQEELGRDHEALWMMPERFDDELFRGVPPCRGGRTLAILASTAKNNIEEYKLLTWNQKQISEIIMENYGYLITRDKIRHDLDDRLVCQGYMKKWGNEYSVTVLGIARYLYSLAKYTTHPTTSAEEVLDICSKHREKILNKYGC